MSTLYEEYASIENQIASLEEKRDALKPEIIKEINAMGKTNLDIGVGSFVIAKLKKWKYPKKVVELENELKAEITTLTDTIKEAKAKAESTGEATFETTDSLRFKAVEL